MPFAQDTQILYELALSIGASNELTPMLRHTLSELLRLTNASGAFVVQAGTDDAPGRPAEAARIAAQLPRTLDRHRGYLEFTGTWPMPRLLETLRARSEHEPLTVPLAEGVAHAFLLPPFGYLVLFRKQGELPDHFLRAFGPLARKLGATARACVLEAELRQQSVRLELATRAANVGVWQLELPEGRLEWNEEMFRLTGVAPQEFHGTLDDFVERLHPDDREDVVTRLEQAVAAGERFEVEFGLVRADGERRQLFGAGQVQRGADGRVTVVGINLDITARKDTEDALRRARDLAEATNRAKSSFIANMSHELRTPLNGMIGMTELALEGDLTPAQREYLRVARSSADSLLAILNDVLDFSRIDAGELRMESIPFSLPGLMAESLKSIASRAQQKGLEFGLDLPPDLPQFSVGDPGRLRQVLVNLCDNALKFTASGSIIVRVRTEPGPDADQVTIAVQDSGTGISPDKLEQIFEAFQQEDVTITRRYGGTGLGLSISRRLAHLMGGQLTVASTPGSGSTFTLSLPLPRGSAPTDAPPTPPRTWDGVRALVVDDSAVGRTTLQLWLRHWGLHADAVESGTEALARLAHEDAHYDLVFLDTVMPHLDGFDVGAAIAADARFPMARVVMLSSGGRRGDAARCRELGIGGYLTKPVAPAELHELLSRLLGSAGPGDAALITRHVLREQPRRRRILLVEDNPVNQAVAQGMLGQLAFEVTLAPDGADAVERLRRERFDLVFMDVQMPVLDGLEATRRIRAEEGEGRRTPIVAMTASALHDERAACLAAGMDDHLAKPIRLAALREMLERYVPR